MDIHYCQLRSYLFKREEKNRVKFKLSELSELWQCTSKQSKRRLQKYQAEDKCIYTPGKGRGNYSELLFSENFQVEIQKISERAIQTNSIDEVIELLQLDIPKEWFGQVFKEIQGMFGIQHTIENQDTIRYILRRSITSLDPLKTAVSREAFMIRQLGDTLVTSDGKRNQLNAGLAHHWQVSADYSCWTFFLRKGVRFHHGRTLTSEDVKFTLLRAKEQSSVVAWQLENIEEIACINDFMVTVKLKIGEPLFGKYMSTGNLTILPYDVPFDEHIWVSTGPFKIKSYSEQCLVLEAFEEYYGERPLMDRVEFWVLENQKLPATTVTTHSEYREEDDYINQPIKNVGVEFLIFNFNRHKCIKQAQFREAIYHLLDSAEMQKTLDIGETASSYYVEKSRYEKKDSEKIESLLRAANYQGETIVLGTFTYSAAKKKAYWLQQRAAKFGISVKIREMPIDTAFYTKEFEEQTDMLILRDIPVGDKELAFLDFCSNPNLLCQRFFSKRIRSSLNKKIEKMKLEESYEQRSLVYEQINQWLSSNHYLIYISHPMEMELLHSAIQNQEKDLFIDLNLRTAWAHGNYGG